MNTVASSAVLNIHVTEFWNSLNITPGLKFSLFDFSIH